MSEQDLNLALAIALFLLLAYLGARDLKRVLDAPDDSIREDDEVALLEEAWALPEFLR